MPRIQDIDIPHLEFAEAAAPGTPAAGIVRIYAKADGLLYQKDDAGLETGLAGAAGSVATDAIWDAAGDLAVGTGANTAAKLAAGATSGHVLTSNGSGVAPSWQAAAGGSLTRTYVGYNTVGGTQQTPTMSRWYLKKVTVASAGVLQSIQLYIREAADSLQVLRAALFEDNAGAIGKFLSATSAMQLAPTNNATFGDGSTTSIARWFGIPVGYEVTATDYWIAWNWTGSGTPKQFYDAGGSDRYWDSGGDFITDGGRYAETDTTFRYSARALVIS